MAANDINGKYISPEILHIVQDLFSSKLNEKEAAQKVAACIK